MAHAIVIFDWCIKFSKFKLNILNAINIYHANYLSFFICIFKTEEQLKIIKFILIYKFNNIISIVIFIYLCTQTYYIVFIFKCTFYNAWLFFVWCNLLHIWALVSQYSLLSVFTSIVMYLVICYDIACLEELDNVNFFYCSCLTYILKFKTDYNKWILIIPF